MRSFMNGAAHGNGIYLSNDINMSLGYSNDLRYNTSSQHNKDDDHQMILAIFEVIDNPKWHKSGTIYVVDDNNIYSTAGIEVKPDFPGGMAKFYKFVGNNYRTPEEEGLSGKVYVTFVVEKDGSLTDIKVVRDIGFGTGKEAIRVLKSCPKWNPGEQNGKKVRVLYSLPITIQSVE
jgi:hypothetical protein